MKLGRRSFLGVVGSAAALGPRGVAKMASGVGLPKGTTVASALGSAVFTGEGEDGDDDSLYDASESVRKLPVEFSGPEGFARFLGVFGIPEHMRDQWRRESNHSTRLDLDLAANRSMSAVAKVLVQRQRNYERLEREWLEYGHGYGIGSKRSIGGRARDAFYERHPWARYIPGI